MWWRSIRCADRKQSGRTALLGLVFILIGVLILLFPELLVALIAAVPITLGVSLLVAAYRQKQLRDRTDDARVEYWQIWKW